MRPALLARLLAALVVAVGLAGPAGAEPCPPAARSESARLLVEKRPDNALLATAVVELPAPAPVYVEYGSDHLGWLRTPASEAAARHEIVLVRLLAASTYQVRAFALDGAGCPSGVAGAELTTEVLPREFRRFAIESSGRPSAPLMLMDLRLTDRDLRWLVALDQEWQPVWYYQIPPELLQNATTGAGANSLIRLANGNLLYLARNWGLEEISIARADAVRQIPLEASLLHHDLYELPDGRVLFLGYEVREVDDRVNGGPPNLSLRGDTLFLLDPATGSYEKVWSVFDTHALTDQSPQWRQKKEGKEGFSHANTVWRGARGNILLSLRFLNQVISLSPDFTTVEWRLGGPGSNFSFPDPSARFFGQHAVTEVGENRLLMFDNGNYRPDGEYSRGLEIELDFGTMTARKVWEYRPELDIFSYAQSSTYRLANGNTLVNFGYRDEPGDPVVLVEVRPDASVAARMDLRLSGQNATRYRVYPLTTLVGEMPVEPTPVSE